MATVTQLRPAQQNLNDAVQEAMNQFVQDMMQSAMTEFMEIVKTNLQNQTFIESEQGKLKQKEFLTRQEAAVYLGCSVGHLDNLIRKGNLSATKIGRLVRIRHDVLVQWLHNQTGGGKT